MVGARASKAYIIAEKNHAKNKTKNKTGPSAKIITFSSFLKLKRLFDFSQE